MRPVPVHDRMPLEDDVWVTLRPAGHILGCATALVEAAGTRTLFSGDLGRPHHPLLPEREDPPAADAVVMESTYGDRVHESGGPDRLAGAVRRTIGRGGSVLIPAFAVDRTEVVLLRLGRLMTEGRVPTVPVFVDSPMALAALDVYRRALARTDPATRPPGWDPRTLGVPDLRMVHTATESEALNRPRRPSIVISASGMATGGRVVHHLAHQLPDPRNCVVLTGYQAQGTRGRELLVGAKQVKIHGRYVPVRAECVDDRSSRSTPTRTSSWTGWVAARRLHAPCMPCTVSRSPPRPSRAG
jgi:metallo-beta-lactamase family protein